MLAKQVEDAAAGSGALAKAVKRAAAHAGAGTARLPRSPPRPRPDSPKRRNTGAAAADTARVPLGPRAGGGLGGGGGRKAERFASFTAQRRQRERDCTQGSAHCAAAHEGTVSSGNERASGSSEQAKPAKRTVAQRDASEFLAALPPNLTFSQESRRAIWPAPRCSAGRLLGPVQPSWYLGSPCSQCGRAFERNEMPFACHALEWLQLRAATYLHRLLPPPVGLRPAGQQQWGRQWQRRRQQRQRTWHRLWFR